MNFRRTFKTLSKEDRDLWTSVSRLVTPLAQRPLNQRDTESDYSTSVRKKPQLALKSKSLDQQQAPIGFAKSEVENLSCRGVLKNRAPSRINLKEQRNLRTGRTSIDARIDLHGLYQAQAYSTLVSFLKRAHMKGFVWVLVITGKGNIGLSPDDRGILRRSVPHWLMSAELRDVIVSFSEADSRHGGSGALYVRLRRHQTSSQPEFCRCRPQT